MKKFFLLALVLSTNPLVAFNYSNSEKMSDYTKLTGEYTVIIEGFDWGAAVTKVVLSNGQSSPSNMAEDYWVNVKRINQSN